VTVTPSVALAAGEVAEISEYLLLQTSGGMSAERCHRLPFSPRRRLRLGLFTPRPLLSAGRRDSDSPSRLPVLSLSCRLLDGVAFLNAGPRTPAVLLLQGRLQTRTSGNCHGIGPPLDSVSGCLSGQAARSSKNVVLSGLNPRHPHPLRDPSARPSTPQGV
jgi:hypothetical protein